MSVLLFFVIYLLFAIACIAYIARNMADDFNPNEPEDMFKLTLVGLIWPIVFLIVVPVSTSKAIAIYVQDRISKNK